MIAGRIVIHEHSYNNVFSGTLINFFMDVENNEFVIQAVLQLMCLYHVHNKLLCSLFIKENI